MQPSKNHTYAALDVGDKRIGVALAKGESRLARPYKTLERSEGTIEELKAIIKREQVTELVVGLPRNMSGEETAQTAAIREFAEHLQTELGVYVNFQDETLTSVKAKEELENRGVAYNKRDVDALAATYILEDYLKEGVH